MSHLVSSAARMINETMEQRNEMNWSISCVKLSLSIQCMYKFNSFNLLNLDISFVSCYLQEVISMLIILSEKSWSLRLSQVYDLFVGMGSDNLGYDDVILIAQVSHGTFRIPYKHKFDLCL
jgi:hypothetical protein